MTLDLSPDSGPASHVPTLADLDRRAFDDLVSRIAARHGVSDAELAGSEVRLRPDTFEDPEDLEDFVAHLATGESVGGTALPPPDDTAETPRSRAIGPDSEAGRAAIARALKDKAKAKQPRRTSPPTPRTKPPRQPQTSKPPSASPRLSQLVRPSRYDGPPWRIITRAPLPREIDPTTARFRRQTVGVGKCTGAKLEAVQRAFAEAYFLAEAARQEVSAIRQSPDALILWHASLVHEEASLAYWFGADYSAAQMGRMLVRIEGILTEWALAFCAGFRGLQPVWIRCKSKNGTGDGPARHLVANMIELFPRYFDMDRHRRTVTLLHEMGHRSTHVTTPRDERHDLCAGGWNSKENMCYRVPSHAAPDAKSGDHRRRAGLFFEGNPRTLAIHGQGRNTSARQTALNNIDNYVCYMWNRGIDRGAGMMRVLAPGMKPPRRIPDPSWQKPPS